MRADNTGSMTRGDSWATNDEWDVDVGLIWAFFARVHSMLADVIAVVSRVEDVCVIE